MFIYTPFFPFESILIRYNTVSFSFYFSPINKVSADPYEISNFVLGFNIFVYFLMKLVIFL